MSPKELDAMLDRVLAELGEHFDAVQIVASVVRDDGSTDATSRGKGNWYARRGMCQMFVEKDQADTQGFAMKPYLNPPDEGDSWKEESEP